MEFKRDKYTTHHQLDSFKAGATVQQQHQAMKPYSYVRKFPLLTYHSFGKLIYYTYT